jgi:clan AA aspartic protease
MQVMKLANSVDEELALRGDLDANRIRSVEIDALVDTGATMLVLPEDVVEKLGLRVLGYRNVRYADGRRTSLPWVGGVKITILDRETIVTALVEGRGTTPLIGQIPLEELDLLVDPKSPKSRELRVNPASPDAPLLDILRAA